MRPYFRFLSFLFITLSLSCNKDDNNNPAVTKLLDYTTSTKGNSPWVYTYNAQGQLIGYENNDYKYSLDINGNELHFVTFYYPENRVTADAIYSLNADGNIVSGHGNFSFDSNAPYTADFTYEYGADGYMYEKSELRNDGTFYHADLYWTQGDLATIIWQKNGSAYSTEYLDYYTGSPDKLRINDNLFLMPLNDFLGNVSKHLQKSSSLILAPNTTPSNEYSYDYDLDNDGFQIELRLDNTGINYHEVINYYYQ